MHRSVRGNRRAVHAGFSFLLLLIVLGSPPAQAFYVSINGDITASSIFPEPSDYQVFNTGELQQLSVSHNATATVNSIYGSATTTFDATAQLGLLSAYADGSVVTELSNVAATEVEAGAKWNDTITITTGGTFTFTSTLTSQVTGGPCKGATIWGIECGATLVRQDVSVVVTSPVPVPSFSLNAVDELDDGNLGQQTQTATRQVTLMAGDQVDITASLGLFLLGWSVDNVSVSATIDALNTGTFTLDPVTPGAAYTTQSGVSYLSPIPIPPAFWLLGSALGLLGWMRQRTT